MKPWIRRLLKIAVTAILTLLVCEGVVRLFGAGGTTLTRGSLHTYDPDAGWICLPDLDAHYTQPGSFNVRVQCNSRGLRDREHNPAKPEGVRRIVVLGDSFMWGYGVTNEEMFSSVLEAALPGTETINLGVNGYSTVQELVRLETEGVRYTPDWAVVMFCWNDLEDNFDDKKGGRPVARLAADGTLHIDNRPVRRQWKSPVTQWFRRNSRLFSFTEYCLALIKARRKAKRLVDSVNAAAGVAPPRPGTGEERAWSMEFSMLDIYARPRPEMDRAWQAVSRILARIRKVMADHGGRVVVAFAPSMETMTRERFTREVEDLASGQSSLEIHIDRPSRRLGDICRDLGIPYVDLNPVFRGQKDPLSLYLKANYHWNAAGHRLAGETTARKILALEKP